MHQKTVRMFLRKRLAELLQRPFSTRMCRHIVMKDLAPAQFHNHQYIKDTESGREHDEEVAGQHCLGVIANKGQPALDKASCLRRKRFSAIGDARLEKNNPINVSNSAFYKNLQALNPNSNRLGPNFCGGQRLQGSNLLPVFACRKTRKRGRF
jgi:hypothetical protein